MSSNRYIGWIIAAILGALLYRFADVLTHPGAYRFDFHHPLGSLAVRGVDEVRPVQRAVITSQPQPSEDVSVNHAQTVSSEADTAVAAVHPDPQAISLQFAEYEAKLRDEEHIANEQKRVAGEAVRVTADVLKEGHDELAVVLRWRKLGPQAAEVREVAMRPLGNDAWELRGDRRGGTIAFDAPPAARGVPGAGTVHHVAWATSVEEHPRWVDQLAAHGVHSTPVVDRHFFKSIYFREPGGVLYEIADEGPGFGRDEDLGRELKLPPWYEVRRQAIEAQLTPIPDPRASWKRTP